MYVNVCIFTIAKCVWLRQHHLLSYHHQHHHQSDSLYKMKQKTRSVKLKSFTSV